MADRGGWDNISFDKKATKARHHVDETRPTTSRQTTKHSTGQRDEDEGARGDDATRQPKEQAANIKRGRKRKVSTSASAEDEGQSLAPRRKSLRSKR